MPSESARLLSSREHRLTRCSSLVDLLAASQNSSQHTSLSLPRPRVASRFPSDVATSLLRSHIRASVYERFIDVLCRDLVTAGARGVPTKKKVRAHLATSSRFLQAEPSPFSVPAVCIPSQHVFADQSPLVSRRLGFAALPLACLVVRVGSQAVGMASRRAESSSSPAEGEVWMSERVRWVLIVFGMLLSWSWYVFRLPASAPVHVTDHLAGLTVSSLSRSCSASTS